MSAATLPACPFDPVADADRAAIWDMLVARDIAAFVAGDWAAVADDFIAEGFFGVDAGKSADVDKWVPRFATLEAYRIEWLRQAAETRALAADATVEGDIRRLTDLSRIAVEGDFAADMRERDGAGALGNFGFDIEEFPHAGQ